MSIFVGRNWFKLNKKKIESLKSEYTRYQGWDTAQSEYCDKWKKKREELEWNVYKLRRILDEWEKW